MAISLYISALVTMHAMLFTCVASFVAMAACNFAGIRYSREQIQNPTPAERPAINRLRRIQRWALVLWILSFVVMVIIASAVAPLHELYKKDWAFGLFAT